MPHFRMHSRVPDALSQNEPSGPHLRMHSHRPLSEYTLDAPSHNEPISECTLSALTQYAFSASHFRMRSQRPISESLRGLRAEEGASRGHLTPDYSLTCACTLPLGLSFCIQILQVRVNGHLFGHPLFRTLCSESAFRHSRKETKKILVSERKNPNIFSDTNFGGFLASNPLAAMFKLRRPNTKRQKQCHVCLSQ